jgi:predicted dithiol-disulfide oxidoreductase (DUF899 family)
VVIVISNSPIVNISKYSRDLVSDLKVFTLNESNFDFAIEVSSYSGNETINENLHRYFKTFVSLYDNSWTSNEYGD